MNMTNNSWKSKLLSSGVPLEFAVARILAEEKFAVTSDYTYSRIDAGHAKDFSIDIEATGYYPFGNANKINATVHLLVECKFSSQNKKWLFFPDPNTVDFSPFTIGTTFSAVDSFSPINLSKNATLSFDQNLELCIKGVEIDPDKGDASEQNIKRGLHQLQYSLPRFFCWQANFGLGSHSEDQWPFFYCSILVTTNDLYVANRNVTIQQIEKAKSIEDIGKNVPYLVTRLDESPDYRNHVKFTASQIFDEDDRALAKAWPYKSEYSWEDPKAIIDSIFQHGNFGLTGNSSQYLVCSLSAFPGLVKELKRTTASALKRPRKKKNLKK